MEHDIGSKIKAARIEKKLTQEQVAELLGVSRQTISNWENGKSYPDIISVIKMSECYDVSLDYLLKGEQKMKTYYDYLEESTNVVKKQHQQKQNYYNSLLSVDLGVRNDCVLVLYKRKRRYGLQFDVPLDYSSCNNIYCVRCYW